MNTGSKLTQDWLMTNVQLPSDSQLYGFLFYRHECFTGKWTTHKIHAKLHPGLEWRIFHKISLLSSLSFKLYLNLLVHKKKHLWVFLECLLKSSEVFGKCSGMFVWPLEQFGKSFEIFGKWSEIFGKSSLCLCNKKNTNLEDMNFMFSWQEQIFSSSFCYMQELLW